MAAGAAKLDEVRPGWEKEINLNGLDMAEGQARVNGPQCGCIGVQLHLLDIKAGKARGYISNGRWAYFVTGLRRVGITAFKSLGFERSKKDNDQGITYEDFDKLWRREIRIRRGTW